MVLTFLCSFVPQTHIMILCNSDVPNWTYKLEKVIDFSHSVMNAAFIPCWNTMMCLATLETSWVFSVIFEFIQLNDSFWFIQLHSIFSNVTIIVNYCCWLSFMMCFMSLFRKTLYWNTWDSPALTEWAWTILTKHTDSNPDMLNDTAVNLVVSKRISESNADQKNRWTNRRIFWLWSRTNPLSNTDYLNERIYYEQKNHWIKHWWINESFSQAQDSFHSQTPTCWTTKEWLWDIRKVLN